MTIYWWETIANIFCVLGIICLAIFVLLPFPRSLYGCLLSFLCAIFCYMRTVNALKKQLPFS